MDYMLDKGSQFETWVGDKAIEGYDLAGDKIKRAASFAKAVHSSNIEDIKEAGQDIARGFNNTVEFGKNKIEAGKHKVAQIKESWRTAINKFYVRRLESEIELSDLQNMVSDLDKVVDAVEIENIKNNI